MKAAALIFQNYYSPARDALFQQMVEQGAKLTVLYAHLPSDEGRRWQEPSSLPYQSVQMRHVAFGKNVLFWVPFRYWRWQGAVVVTDNNPTNLSMILWTALFWALRRRIGVWVEHIPDVFKGRYKLAFQRTCTRMLCAMSRRVIAFSTMTGTYLGELTSNRKVDRMVQATPTYATRPFPRYDRRLRRFGYLGSNVDRKNVGALRQAFEGLKLNDLELHFAGFEGVDENPQIKVHGYVDGARRDEFFQSIDVLVLPSFADPWGFVVNEALGWGCLAIVTDRCGSAELVGRVAPELICDPSVASIAQSLASALQADASTIVAWRAAAKNALHEYSIEEAATRLMKICERITS